MEVDALHPSPYRARMGCFLFYMANTPTLPQTSPKERAERNPNIAADVYVRSQPTREYVSGGFYKTTIDSNAVRILSNQLDDLEKVVGPKIYEHMLNEPAIAKALTILKTTTLSDGLEITPAFTAPVEPTRPIDSLLEDTMPGATPNELREIAQRNEERVRKQKEYEELFVKYEEEKARYEIAKRIADVSVRALNNLSRPLSEILEEMMDAMAFGHKVAEVTYELVNADKNEEDEGLYYFRYIKVKPQKTVAFVVDDYHNLLGFKAAISNEDRTRREKKKGMMTVRGSSEANDFEVKVIPRDKFAVLTFRPKDSDPRGTSILRAIYNVWHFKQLMWPEYLRWLMQCAIPGLVGIAPPANENKNYVINADGSIATHPTTGEPLTAPTTDAMAMALSQMRNASYVAVPHGAEVKPIHAGSTSEPFKTSRDVLNEEMESTLLLQTLATSDSRHNTRAASETHLSILDVLIYRLKSWIIDMIIRDILTPWIRYTFGSAFLPYMPRITMGDTERREFATDAGVTAQLHAANWFDISQISAMDKQLGLPTRAEGWERRMLEKNVAPNWHLSLAKTKQEAEKAQTVAESKSASGGGQANKQTAKPGQER